jgi:hypothetical protein
MLKEQKMVRVHLWIDELKFEKLGTIAQPSISNGQDKVETQFKGNSVNMANYGLTQTFNLESGLNQTVTPAIFLLSHLILKWLELVMQEL